jgi:hypothetical protein
MEVAQNKFKGGHWCQRCFQTFQFVIRVTYPYCLNEVIRISLYWWNSLQSEEVRLEGPRSCDVYVEGPGSSKFRLLPLLKQYEAHGKLHVPELTQRC